MALKQEAFSCGFDFGKAAGSWVVDGNSSVEFCRKIIDGYADGDPEVMDMQPAPLSGEYADDAGIIEDVRQRFGDDDELLASFEEGYSNGYWREVLRSANYQVRGVHQ